MKNLNTKVINSKLNTEIGLQTMTGNEILVRSLVKSVNVKDIDFKSKGIYDKAIINAYYNSLKTNKPYIVDIPEYQFDRNISVYAHDTYALLSLTEYILVVATKDTLYIYRVTVNDRKQR